MKNASAHPAETEIRKQRRQFTGPALVSTETSKSRVTTDKIDPSPVVSRRTRVDGTAEADSVLATVSPCSSSILTVGAHKLVARFLGGSPRKMSTSSVPTEKR
uniref:Uncharacterized protein n=1 Tax=Peronospora matthiolae TaxID=2874970 RepID=A0AAV1VLH9_9STRA